MKAFRWVCVLGSVLVGPACDEPQDEELGSQQQSLSANQRILGFERVSATPSQSDWVTSAGVLSAATPSTQGSQALGVANIGWAQLESAPLSALGAVTASLKMDLRIPGSGSVAWGDVQVFLHSTELSLFNEPVGQRLLAGTTAGSYQTIELALPSHIVTKLSGPDYSDLVVRIALNLPQSPTPVLVDHLRFDEPSGGTGGAGGASNSGGASAGGSGASSGSGGSNAGTGTSGGSSGSGTSGGSSGSSGSAGSGGADVGPCLFAAPTSGATTLLPFSLKLPSAVARRDVVLGASGGYLQVNDGVQLRGTVAPWATATSMAASGDLRLGVSAEALELYSDRGVTIGDRAHVHGSVFAATTISTGPETVVDGQLRSSYDATPLRNVAWDVAFPNQHRGDCSLEPGALQQLRPAAYGNVMVKQGGRLTLTPGTYFFESLSIEPSAILNLLNSDGLVVYVRGQFSFKGQVEEAHQRSNVLFGIAGAAGAYFGAPFRGVVVAPNGSVELASTPEGHIGQFFGKVVTAHQYTSVTLRPFESGTACGRDSSCGSFCPCTTGDECETTADCADGLVCPFGNGPRHGRARGTSVCEPSECSFRRRDLGCGFLGAACGSSCDDGLGCNANADCPAGEVCALGKGALTESEAPNVCLPPACLEDAEATGCGTTVDLCGKCACASTCSTKQCGDSPVDACGDRCRSFCGPRDAGCTADADCPSEYACIVGGGPRIGLAEGVNVCLPQGCISPNPSQQSCGQIGAPCGLCPEIDGACHDRTCGLDPSGRISCGGALPPGQSCVQGVNVAKLDEGELAIDTTNRNDGQPISIEPLPVSEPATESSAGAVEGSFDVNERGTATYTIPIAVPPGRDGIEPALSLRYDGQANGVAGVGWSLSGLSSLARCPKIAATDGWAVPVQYDQNDRFCLDGQRLVRVSGEYGAVGSVYRTEIDTLDKVSLLADGADGRPYFEVRKKDGRIFRYGYGENSRIYRNVAEQIVRVWALSRIEDRRGNYASFDYGKFESAEKRNLLDVSGEPIVDVENETVEFFLKSVAYGGLDNPLAQVAPRRLVELEYDPFRFDYMDGTTRGGARVARTQLLTKITTSVGGAKVRSYELGYGGVQVPGPLGDIFNEGSETRRLAQVKECSYKHGERVCKRPTKFLYTEEHGLEATAQVTAFPQLKPESPRSIIKLDWNGDGREDLLVQKGGSLNDPGKYSVWTLLVATGNRTGAAFVEAPLEALTGPSHAGGCISQNSIVDINHDGNDDVINLCGSGRLQRKWRSTSDLAAPFAPFDGWDLPLPGSARSLLVDLDADGFMDQFTCGEDNYVRSLHNAEYFPETTIGVIFPEDNWGVCYDNDSQTPDDPLMVQDIDGDGYGEVLMYRKPYRPGPGESRVSESLWARYVVTDEGQSAYWQQIWLPLSRRAYSDGTYRFVDLNGDGLKDLIFLDIDQSKTPLLSLNFAGVFSPPRNLYSDWDQQPPIFATLYSLRNSLPLDYDGDGAQDIIRRFDQQAAGAPLSATSLWQWDRTQHQVTKYTNVWGDSSLVAPDAIPRLFPQPGVTPPQRGYDVPAMLADVDGDGSADLVQFDGAGSVHVHHGRFGRESLLRTVTDGIGKRIEIRYDSQRSTAEGATERVYTPAEICQDIEQEPRSRCLNNPGPLVSDYEVSLDIGEGEWRVDRKTRLRYEDAREGLWGRGFYGFRRRITEELSADGALIERIEVIREVRPRLLLVNEVAPFAGREFERIVTTAPAQSSIEQQATTRRVRRVNTWKYKTSALGGILPFVESSIETVDEVGPTGVVPGLETRTSNDIDLYGNRVSTSQETRVRGTLVSTSTAVTSFAHDQARLADWLIALVRRSSRSDRVYDERSEEPYLGRAFQYSYDELGLLTQVIREPDEDAPSNLRQVVAYGRTSSDPFRRVQSLTVSGSWLEDGQVISQDRVALFEYDPEVIFPKRTKRKVGCDPDGSGCRELVTDVSFDPRDGTLLGLVDPAGIGSQAAYDSFGRLVKEVRASGTTTIEYADANPASVNGRLVPAQLQMVAKNLATGEVTTRRIDSLGRIVQVDTTGFEQPHVLQEFEYVWGGLLKFASRPHLPGDSTQGAITQQYDARWRLQRRTFPDSTYIELSDGAVGNVNLATEAHELRARSRRDQRGNVSHVFSDARGNPLRTVDELGHSTRFRYDPFSTLAMIADYRANLTHLRSDRLGRLIEHEDADTGVKTYRYTAFDQVQAFTDGDGGAVRERSHQYDELGRLTTLQAPEGPTAFAYDGPGENTEGRLVETTSPSGATEHYEYELRPLDGDPMKNRGFVEHVSRLIDGTAFTTTLHYDPTTSQLNRVQYPESAAGEPFAARYGYDAFGNLKSVTSTSPDGSHELAPIWSLDQAYQGQSIAQETFGNGVTTAYGYEDATGRLASLVTKDPANATLQDLRYTAYDNNGNLKTRISTLKRVGASASDSYTENFNYDALDRLDDYSVNGASSDLQYDELGNITFKSGVGSYDYLEDDKPYRPHAVAAIVRNGSKVADYRYDEFGNLAQRSGEGVIGGSQDLEYNSFNKPTKITLGGGGGGATSQVRYEYDAAQQRVLLAVGDCDSDPSPTCNKRIYVGGAYERQTTTEAGVPITRHLYKVFAGSRQVAQVDREQRQGATVETRRYIHGDHLGSSQLFTDETGVLTHVQRFDPFGAPIDSGSTPDATSARIRAGFTGHETDVETGLVNMGGRLYDPRIGRVLQADPPFMESPLWSQGLNRYSYVFNNPLNAIDPSGFMTEHDHPEDEDVEVTESIDPGTGVTTYEQPDIVEESESSTEEAETSPSEDPDDDEMLDDDALDDTGETLSSSQDDGFPQIPDFLDWIGGFGLGYAQGMVPGGTFLPIPPGSDGYQLSVALGQLVGGLNALQTGATVATGGGLATATGVGSPVGVPTIAAGAAVAVGGGVNVANAVGNIVKMGGGDDPPSGGGPPAAADSGGSPPTVLQSGGNTIKPATAKALGLTKEQARDAMHALKPDVGAPNDKIGKIMSNGDYVDKETGQVLGNLYDYVN